MDNFLSREFLCWEQKPSIERDSSLFMYRVYNEDILSCLTFPNTEVREENKWTHIIKAFFFINSFHPEF